MPLNNKKIISIILDQASEIDERCDGYKKELINAISDILLYEREHRISATSIQKKINEKCNATAHFLVEQRGQNVNDTGAGEMDS